MRTEVKLKIAGNIITLESNFLLEGLSQKEKKIRVEERFNNFIYNGRKRPDIRIKINLVDKLPSAPKTKPLFITFHPDDGEENWRLYKTSSGFIYQSPLEGKKQLMLIKKDLKRVTAYVLPKKGKGRVWNISDIIYDFLQVLLINFCARYKKGIFVHSVGIKDADHKGLLFAGESGAGKSTTARIWHKHSLATVLNDDRIIVSRIKNHFFIHGSPWHGEFSDYLRSRIDSAILKKIFFIYHARKNKIRNVSPVEAFRLIYPALFPTFWDKACLENIISFSWDLVNAVSSSKLGFLNDKRIINFVRSKCGK